MRSRLGQIASLPMIKDLEKMERVRRLWEPWYERWMSAPDDVKLWDYGFALGELRISIFAPDVPVVGKVSEKRVEDAWEKLNLGK